MKLAVVLYKVLPQKQFVDNYAFPQRGELFCSVRFTS